jgi:hypothetical protein
MGMFSRLTFNLTLLAAAFARFRRSRLVLD